MAKEPVLLICFNRLNAVRQSFAAIKKYRPNDLYIAQDGPRKQFPEDVKKCEEVREWIKNHIDWNCDVHTLFRTENVGCGYGPSEAISWMFATEEQGIIIEDDCIPHPDFFAFCEEMLLRYRQDDSVMAVNGMQCLQNKYTRDSYYFSMQNSSFCGWATWKRAWQYFDFKLKGMTVKDVHRDMKRYGVTRSEIRWWTDIFRNLRGGVYGDSSWDYQFIFSIWHHHAKTIMPAVNLVSNIGFDSEATHTGSADDPQAALPTYPILPISHPCKTKICRKADLDYHREYYERFMEIVPWYIRLKRYVKKILISFVKL